jgi:hypothetical protein
MVDIDVIKTYIACDPAGRDSIVHSVQAAKKSRFSAAGRPDHGQNFVAIDINTDIVDGTFVAIVDLHIPTGHAWIVYKRGADGFPAVRRDLTILKFPGNVSAEHRWECLIGLPGYEFHYVFSALSFGCCC